MKKITLLLLTIFILFSCSSDDPIDSGGSIELPQRKVIKVENIYSVDNRLYTITTLFSYNQDGRWIEEKDISLNKEDVYPISYSGNKINCYGSSFTLNNNLIEYRSDNTAHIYSNGYLAKIGKVDFEYTNGNLTKIIDGSDSETYNIE